MRLYINRKSPDISIEAFFIFYFLFLVRLAGFEPTTPWFVAKYSIQLSYSREACYCRTKFTCLTRKFKKTSYCKTAAASKQRARRS